jgi:hypothetical protein
MLTQCGLADCRRHCKTGANLATLISSLARGISRDQKFDSYREFLKAADMRICAELTGRINAMLSQIHRRFRIAV